MQPPGSVQYDAEARRWVLRRGLLLASVYGGRENLLTLSYGAAEMVRFSIYEALLGGGLFVGQEMLARGPSVRLTTFAPSNDPAATPTDLDDPKQSTLVVREIPEALELRYKSLNGLPMGSVLLALDFAPGGVWESAEGAVRATPGQTFHLKEGPGRMRYGRDCIELGLGAAENGQRRLRDAPISSEHVRILISLETPADEVVQVKTYQENPAKWRA